MPIAALIGTAFGGLWAAVAAVALPSSWTPWAISAALAITLILAARLWFSPAPASGPLFRMSAYRVAVVLEIAGLAAVGYLLSRYRLDAYLVPTIGIVVGLHFIGLWKASGNRAYLWIAGLMCAVSAVSIVLPAAPAGSCSPRILFAGYGNALVLWIGASVRK